MVTEVTNQTALAPDRHPQQELFVCDIADAALKDDMASMEHPLFSLSKKPDLKIRRYENGDKWVEITPSVKGMATIYDKDILIFAISQLMAAKKEGRPISRKIEISAREFLIFSNRYTGGRDYELLKTAIERLKGTMISTNIETGKNAPTKIFGIVEEAAIHTDPKTKRVTKLEIVLSEWLYRAISNNEVLTLSPFYFRLRKPLERRIYEIARKHCGAQLDWKISLPALQRKCGSNSPQKQFRYLIRDLVKNNHLPDYSVFLDESDFVIFHNRRAHDKLMAATLHVQIDSGIYHDARQLAPGWDISYIEQQWRSWMHEGGLDAPKDPEAAFLGFCRRFYERHGKPK